MGDAIPGPAVRRWNMRTASGPKKPGAAFRGGWFALPTGYDIPSQNQPTQALTAVRPILEKECCIYGCTPGPCPLRR